jgi:PKD repeat protein
VASFVAVPDSGCAPLPVSFGDQSTGTGINGWSWDFGDGGTSTSQNPQHLYADPGSYTVRLIVSDGSCADSLEVTGAVQVLQAAPVAAFSADVLTGEAPLPVSFTDESTGAPTSWSWDFGDGNGSSEQHASHTYQDPGTYSVTLVAASDCGADSLVQVDHVLVTPNTTSVPFGLEGRGSSWVWPNPMGPLTQIYFRLERPESIAIVIYDVSGRPVRHLVSRQFAPGTYTIPFDGTSDRGKRLASGLYVYRFVAGDRVETRKLVVSR